METRFIELAGYIRVDAALRGGRDSERSQRAHMCSSRAWLTKRISRIYAPDASVSRNEAQELCVPSRRLIEKGL